MYDYNRLSGKRAARFLRQPREAQNVAYITPGRENTSRSNCALEISSKCPAAVYLERPLRPSSAPKVPFSSVINQVEKWSCARALRGILRMRVYNRVRNPGERNATAHSGQNF